MSAVPPLLDDDGYAEGRAGNPGGSRCSVTEARGRLEAINQGEAGGECAYGGRKWHLIDSK